MNASSSKDTSRTKKILTIVGYSCLAILFAFAFFLRVHNLGGASLWIDEGYTINAATAIRKTGFPILPSGAHYTAHMGSTYLTAAALSLGTFDPWHPWQTRLPAALFGTLAIFATYFFSRAYYKRRDVALVAALIIAFSVWEIAWSRQARGYVIMQCFSLFSLAFFTAWLRDKKIAHGVGALLCFIGAYLGQSIAMILAPVYVAMLILSLLAKQHWNWRTIAILMSIIALTTLGVFLVIHYFLHGISINIQPQYLLYLWKTYPLLLLVTLVPLAGLFFTHERPLPLFYNTLAIIIPWGILMFITPTLQYRYLLVIFPFMIVQAALGIALLVQFLFKERLLKHLVVASVLGVLLGIGIFHSYINIQPFTFYALEPGSPQPSFASGYAFIKNNKAPNDIILSPYAHLTSLYLGTPDILLPVSLTGQPNEVATTTKGGIDFYTGAPAVMNEEQLRNILTYQQGFIIIDRLAESRLKKTYLPLILSLPNVVEVFNKQSGPSFIKVYQFKPLP